MPQYGDLQIPRLRGAGPVWHVSGIDPGPDNYASIPDNCFTVDAPEIANTGKFVFSPSVMGWTPFVKMITLGGTMYLTDQNREVSVFDSIGGFTPSVGFPHIIVIGNFKSTEGDKWGGLYSMNFLFSEPPVLPMRAKTAVFGTLTLPVNKDKLILQDAIIDTNVDIEIVAVGSSPIKGNVLMVWISPKEETRNVSIPGITNTSGISFPMAVDGLNILTFIYTGFEWVCTKVAGSWK